MIIYIPDDINIKDIENDFINNFVYLSFKFNEIETFTIKLNRFSYFYLLHNDIFKPNDSEYEKYRKFYNYLIKQKFIFSVFAFPINSIIMK